MHPEALKIIEEIFGEEGKIPIRDPKTFDAMPLSFWQTVKKLLDQYLITKNIPDLFLELKELVKVAGNMGFEDEEIYILFMNPPMLTVTGKLGKTKVFSRRNSLFFIESMISTRLMKFSYKDRIAADFKGLSDMPLVHAVEKKQYDDRFFNYVKKFFALVNIHVEQFTELFNWMNAVLKDFLIMKGFPNRAINAEKKVTQRFREHRRQFLRDEYQKYDSEISHDFFVNDPVKIAYPQAMIDRILIRVYSPDYMAYNPTVAGVVVRNSIKEDVYVEQMMSSKRRYIEAGYTEDEIASIFPVGLDKEFSLRENRSVLSNFRLTGDPKVVKDGIGHAYLWRTEGITYRFVYEHPSGNGPMRLDMVANMQRIIYKKLAEDCKEIVEAFNNELIEETNFIPLGFEE